jgi:hypothetical protein
MCASLAMFDCSSFSAPIRCSHQLVARCVCVSRALAPHIAVPPVVARPHVLAYLGMLLFVCMSRSRQNNLGT